VFLSLDTKSSRLTAGSQYYAVTSKRAWVLLYPPHIRRMPLNALLPCNTRQLLKTVHVVSVKPAQAFDFAGTHSGAFLAPIVPSTP
jgi:hypothetical protein